MWSVIKESKGNQFRISFLSQLLLFYFLSSMRRGGCNVKLKQRVGVASHENSSMGWWTEEKATNLVCQHLCSENQRLFFFSTLCVDTCCWFQLFKNAHFFMQVDRGKRSARLPVYLSCKFRALRSPDHRHDKEPKTKSVAGGSCSPGH